MNRFVSLFGVAVLAQPLPWNPSVSSFQTYDRIFEFSLDDGCRYDTHISGTLTPVFPYLENGKNMEPNFDISTHLVCPRTAPLHIQERLEHTGPLTREHVEALISHYATIAWDDDGRRCSHVPAIRLQGDNLVCNGVTTSCNRTVP